MLRYGRVEDGAMEFEAAPNGRGARRAATTKSL